MAKRQLDDKDDAQSPTNHPKGEIFCHSKANKSQHNVVFSSWLVKEFGQQYLRSGEGVLDLAGGNGLLSYELAVRYGIRSTMVEPKDVQLSSMLRRKIGKVTKGRIRSESERQEAAAKDSQSLMAWLSSREMFLPQGDDGIVDSSVSMALEDKSLLPFRHIRCSLPLYSPSNPKRVRSEMDEIFSESIFQSASVFVGMHPDQITEMIVDLALENNKSFAVVPCCVFSNLFRFTFRNGRLVSSYEEFLEYLEEKDAAIKRAQLPFLGRNVVLFRKVVI